MAHILSYGSLNLDLVYQVPHFVQAGETLSSTSRTVHCGGKGLNQSIAAARAGGTVSHAGKIGGDGTVLTDILRESGVDTDFVTVGDGPSGHAVIQVDPSGQNCILLFGGCNQEITHEEIDRALAHFQTGDYLILQNEINGLDYLMTQAARQGLRIVFNPSPTDESIFRLPLGEAWLLIFNEIEGAALSGCDDEARQEAFAMRQEDHTCMMKHCKVISSSFVQQKRKPPPVILTEQESFLANRLLPLFPERNQKIL